MEAPPHATADPAQRLLSPAALDAHRDPRRCAAARAVLIAVALLVVAGVSACSGSSTRAVAPSASPSPSNACDPPAPAARQAILASLRGGSTITGLSSYAFVFPIPHPQLVDVLAARVSTPLPSLDVTRLTPTWAWSDGRLFAVRGDATLASFGLPPFAGAGGGLDEAQQAVEKCVAASTGRAEQAVVTTIPDVTAPPGSTVRVSGALTGTLRGVLDCMGGQASGSYHVGGATLALELSGNGLQVSVIHPPGGAPLWDFLDLPPASIGVRPGSRAVAFHARIPIQPIQHSTGRAPVAPLALDGTLRCG